jgi:hypothetical protein
VTTESVTEHSVPVAKVVALTEPKRRAWNVTLHPTNQDYILCNYHQDEHYLSSPATKGSHQLPRSRMYALENIPCDRCELHVHTRTQLQSIVLLLFNS